MDRWLEEEDPGAASIFWRVYCLGQLVIPGDDEAYSPASWNLPTGGQAYTESCQTRDLELPAIEMDERERRVYAMLEDYCRNLLPRLLNTARVANATR